jgi:response regulator NasT
MTAVIAEDESLIRLYLVMSLGRRGITVVGETGHGSEAIELLKTHKPDIAVLDIRLADDVDGIEVARSVTGEQSTCVVLMSAYEVEQETLSESIPRFTGFLSKPVTESDLDHMVSLLRDRGCSQQ